MSRENNSRAAALALIVVVAVSIAGYLLLGRNRGGATAGGSGFQERAQQAGIAFRMNFLTREQGERFRINLYDHGARASVSRRAGAGAAEGPRQTLTTRTETSS